MIRTRVGYAGGSKSNPTYRSLGNHSETIQVDFDPAVVAYEELLAVFWNSHNPVGRSVSRQYASIIFYHDDAQRRLAEKTKEHWQTERGSQFTTEIVAYTEFWLAEEYHQKHRLQGIKALMEEFKAIYPNPEDFVNSTAAARVNGYVGGYGTMEQLENEIDGLGLSPEGQETLQQIAQRLHQR